MSFIFGTGTGKTPQMPAVQQVVYPAPTDYAGEAAAKDAAERQRKAAALAKGASSTILTGGLGLQEDPTVARKKLFGQ